MNVLVVGLGSIAKKHITALNSLNIDVNIFALRSAATAEKYECVINVFDLEDIDTAIDFAIISNPTNLHFKTIEQLASKSIPLFIEKPAVHQLKNVTQLINYVEDRCKISYVACNLRFHPCIQFFKNYIQENDFNINEVNIYCGSYLPDWRPGKNYKEIYSANNEMGGGVHLDLFHEMDYSCWIFGYPNACRGFWSSKSTLNITAPDYANYLLSYKTFNVSIILNYFRRKPKRTIEVIGSNDTWVIDLITNQIISESRGVIFTASDYNIVDSYKTQMHYFINCLIHDKKPMNSLRESVEILKLSLKNESIKG